MSFLRGTSGVKVGAGIAAIGGLAFILGGAALLPDGGIPYCRSRAGLVAAIAVITLTMLRHGGPRRPGPGLHQRVWLIYWAMVIFEIVVLRVGNHALITMDHPELSMALSALIVGMHFLPFAKAFSISDFKPLGWTLMAVGLMGGALALALGETTGVIVVGAAGVLSGIVMFTFSLRLGRRIAVA
jgi:hypothetical protein